MDKRKFNGTAKPSGPSPEYIKKYHKAKRLLDEGLSLTIACMRADISRKWFRRIESELEQ